MSSPIAQMSTPENVENYTIVDGEEVGGLVEAAPPVKVKKVRAKKSVKAVVPVEVAPPVEFGTPMPNFEDTEEGKAVAELRAERNARNLFAEKEETFVIIPKKEKAVGIATVLKKSKDQLSDETIERLVGDADGDLLLALEELIRFRALAEKKRQTANEASKKSKAKTGEEKKEKKAKLEDRVSKLEAVIHRDGSGADE